MLKKLLIISILSISLIGMALPTQPTSNNTHNVMISENDKKAFEKTEASGVKSKEDATRTASEYSNDTNSQINDIANSLDELEEDDESKNPKTAFESATRNVEKSGPLGVFFNTSKQQLNSLPNAFFNFKLWIYMLIVNFIDNEVGRLGGKISTMMGMFIIVFATFQLMWNGLKYILTTVQNNQPINIQGFIMVQVPYITKVAMISVVLLTNLYWYVYFVLIKNVIVMLGGAMGGLLNVTYSSVTYRLIAMTWMPLAIIGKSLISALLIVPIFNGVFWTGFLFGWLLMLLVGKALQEFILIVIEYAIVGVFSIVVIPLALLDITKHYGGMLTGAIIAAGMNLLVAVMLTIYVSKLVNIGAMSYFELIFSPTAAYFKLLLIYAMIFLLSKAKTMGNFLVRGQGRQVKGSDLVTEGIMGVVNLIATAISIATIVTGIGAVVSAAQAAAAAAAKAATQKVAEEATKTAMKEAGKQAVKEGAKQGSKEAVKEGTKAGVKEFNKQASQLLNKMNRNSNMAKGIGNQIARMQQNGEANMSDVKDMGQAIYNARSETPVDDKGKVGTSQNNNNNVLNDPTTGRGDGVI